MSSSSILHHRQSELYSSDQWSELRIANSKLSSELGSDLLEQRIADISRALIQSCAFLVTLDTSGFTDQQWAQYIQLRMGDQGQSSSFELFLERSIEKAEQDGSTHILAALRANLDEERGSGNPERTHAASRRRFVESSMRQLPHVGINTSASYEYGEALLQSVDRLSVPQLAGGFALLERLIADEYTTILPHFHDRFRGQHDPDYAYLRDHAHHDVRHTKESCDAIHHSYFSYSDIREGLLSIAEMKLRFFEQLSSVLRS